MSIRYHFDLYPRADPRDGARLVRFTKLQSAEYRGEANGTGAGRFSIRGDDAEAQFIDPAGLQYVRVVRDDGSTELVVGGFFLDNGDFEALTENGTRLLTFGGAGTLSYLQRAVMWSHTYMTSFTAQDPFDDTWRLFLQSSVYAGGDTLGAIAWRVLTEAKSFRVALTPHKHVDGATYTDSHADDRTESAIPDVVLDFTGFVDSDAASWAKTSGEFKAQVGENVLQVIKRLMEAGLYVSMDPDTFELSAWEADGHRRTRTGASWGASVIRFQAPTDGTVATGNIKSDALRGIAAFIKRKIMLAGGQDVYAKAAGTTTIPWEGFYPADVEDTTALGTIATTQLGARDDAGDTLRLRMKLEADPANGKYLPFEHILLDDIVTVHTGTGQWDYNEDTFPVAALTIALRPGGDWDAWADLGSTYTSMAERAFQAAPVKHHPHPPNPRLCSPSAASVDQLRHIASASIKVSGENPAAPRTNANDGNDATTWSEGVDDPALGVAEAYWAADMSAAQEIHRYRILQQGGTNDNVQNVATEVRLYGSDDPAAWTWLPAGKLAADPAANGWTLIETYTGALVLNDTGEVALGSLATHRYWLFRAVTGGTVDWDVETFELWSEEQNSVAGTSNEAARCDHSHNHNDLANRDSASAHAASAVSFTPTGTIAATNVQAAIAEVASEAGGGGGSDIDVSHLTLAHVFPIIAHHGDTNPTDGYPENTLEAFRQAVLRGVHGVEFDVQMSADGTWYAHHDVTVTRTTDGTGDFDAKTDAQIAALNIDGGSGYDAGRHGTSLNVPTLDAVLDAVDPYDVMLWFDLKVDVSGATPGGGHTAGATALANYIVSKGLVERSVAAVYSTAAATAVKAVDANIEVALVTVSGSTGNSDVDRLYCPQDDITNLAFVTSRAPKPVDAWPLDIYGTDQDPTMQDMWDRGARSWTSDDLPAALLKRLELLGSSGVSDHGALTGLADDDHTHYLTEARHDGLSHTGSGEILISDTPAGTPLVFADLLQNEAQDDLLYEG